MKIIAGIIGAIGGAIFTTIIVGLIISTFDYQVESLWPIIMLGAVACCIISIKSEKVRDFLIEFIG